MTSSPFSFRGISVTVARVNAALRGGCNSYNSEPVLPHQVAAGSRDVTGVPTNFTDNASLRPR